MRESWRSCRGRFRGQMGSTRPKKQELTTELVAVHISDVVKNKLDR